MTPTLFSRRDVYASRERRQRTVRRGLIRRHKRLAALALTAWLAFGLWQPVLGADLLTALIGLTGLRYLAHGYRWLYRLGTSR